MTDIYPYGRGKVQLPCSQPGFRLTTCYECVVLVQTSNLQFFPICGRICNPTVEACLGGNLLNPLSRQAWRKECHCFRWIMGADLRRTYWTQKLSCSSPCQMCGRRQQNHAFPSWGTSMCGRNSEWYGNGPLGRFDSTCRGRTWVWLIKQLPQRLHRH